MRHKNKRSRAVNSGATAENDTGDGLFSTPSIHENAPTCQVLLTPGWLLADQARQLEAYHLGKIAYHTDHARRARAILEWVERMVDDGWTITEATAVERKGRPAAVGPAGELYQDAQESEKRQQ
jgi:hypothetical protein